MGPTDEPSSVSRRTVLTAAGGAIGLGSMGTARAGLGDRFTNSCPDATVRPSMSHHEHGGMRHCADDHPVTKRRKQAVSEALESRFPTVGALIDRGFVPYFDFLPSMGGERWSHWLNPDYIADDSILDPKRPESILVDHKWWRPIGVMFIATRNGERVDDPPVIYRDEAAGTACDPWHAHTGLPGRYAWWKYRLAYGTEFSFGQLQIPCATPWMMHIWAYPHPDSVYAHAAPPPENRGGPPAEPAGFETDAVPGEDELSWEVLPDALVHRVKHKW